MIDHDISDSSDRVDQVERDLDQIYLADESYRSRSRSVRLDR